MSPSPWHDAPRLPTLLIRGVRIPGAGGAPTDIAVTGAVVTAIGDGLAGGPDTYVIDAAGAVAVPGLVDIHGHFYRGGTDSSVDADLACLPSGVTTAVDGGSAGAHTFGAFVRGEMEHRRVRLLAFLNLSAAGMSPVPLSGELRDVSLADVGLAVDTAARHADRVVGFKARVSARACGSEENVREVLRRLLQAGERAGLPVMVHASGSPVRLAEIVDALRPGDILTHVFAGGEETVLDGGRVADAVAAGAERGVVFDVGHAVANMDFEVARTALAEGLVPTTLSTDAHRVRGSRGGVSLLDVIDEMVELGLPIDAALAAATSAPARVLGRADVLGEMAVGRIADITILRTHDEPRTHADGSGRPLLVQRRTTAEHTIKDGRLYSDL